MANLKEQVDMSETIAPPEPEKRCTRCEAVKPIEEFHRNGTGKWKPQCAACRAEARPSRRGLPGRKRDRLAERRSERVVEMAKYGITVGQYEEMKAVQGGVCAICHKPQAGRLRLAVDHCHETGRVRALLCATCNGGLGLYEQHLRRPKDYAGYLAKYGRGNALLGYEDA